MTMRRLQAPLSADYISNTSESLTLKVITEDHLNFRHIDARWYPAATAVTSSRRRHLSSVDHYPDRVNAKAAPIYGHGPIRHALYSTLDDR